jgi:NAD(P)-dependent dehydrogenase (short-subunit alcohol dehydrogenase family)
VRHVREIRRDIPAHQHSRRERREPEGRRNHEQSLEDWRAVLDVNLSGQFLCVREAIRRFLAQGPACRSVDRASACDPYSLMKAEFLDLSRLW